MTPDRAPVPAVMTAGTRAKPDGTVTETGGTAAVAGGFNRRCVRVDGHDEPEKEPA